MSIATPQELVSHAVAGNEIKADKVTNLKDTLYREVKKKTKKGFYDESLNTLNGEAELASDKLRQVVINFGTAIDDKTGEVKPNSTSDPATGETETGLVENLKEEIELIEELCEKGFNSLGAEQQIKIRKIVEEKLKSNSSISKDLENLNDLNGYLNELIQSPAFIPKLKELVNGYARDGELDSSFLDAYQAYMEKKAEQDAAKKKEGVLTNRINRVKTELREYESKDGYEGKKFKRLRELEDKALSAPELIPSLQRRVDDDKAEMDKLIRIRDAGIQTPANETGLQRDQEDYESKKTAFVEAERIYNEFNKPDANVNTLSNLLTKKNAAEENLRKAKRAVDDTASRQPAGTEAAERNIAILRGRISEQERELSELKSAQDGAITLKTELNRFKAEEEEALKELADLEGETGKVTSEVQKAFQEYNRAVNLRKGQQVAFAKKLEASYGEAGHRVKVAEMVFANTQAKILHDEFEKQSFTDAERVLNNFLAGDRWHLQERIEFRGVPGFRRTVRYRPTNRSQINTDWRTMIDSGEEALLKDMLLNTNNPNKVPPGRYSPSEVSDILDDPDTLTRMKDIATKNLILKRIQNGGMTQEDIDVLAQRQLGTGITEALSQRADLKGKIETIMGAGAFERHDFKSRFTDMLKKYPWFLLTLLGFPLALLGPISLPVAAALAATGPAGIAVKAKFMDPQDESQHAQG